MHEDLVLKFLNCKLIKLDNLCSLQKTPLASLLDQPGPITVLAPTTAAFDAMIEEHLKYLMSPDVRMDTKTDKFVVCQWVIISSMNNSPDDWFWIPRVTANCWSFSGTTLSRPPRWEWQSADSLIIHVFPLTVFFYLPVMQLEIYNAVSTPRYVTMANQVLTITVMENVSVDFHHL